MSFAPPFKAQLKSECIATADVGEKAVLTNLHEDYRIPTARATDFEDYARGTPGLLVNRLYYYTKERIRQTRKRGGFVHQDNDLNKLGLSKPLKKKPADFFYGRLLELTNLFFFRALETGIEYLVQEAHQADASDFDPLFTRAGKASEEIRFGEYCAHLRRARSLGIEVARAALEPLFQAYRGYIDAIDDARARAVPYEPAWITSWETVRRWDLESESADDWCKALGVQYSYSSSETSVWALLKYRLPAAYDVYRPTCLEAGKYSLHYPTHCGIGTVSPAISGHTMDCRAAHPSESPQEWIHLNCALEAQHLIKLAFIRAPFPDLSACLPGWRQRHYGRLTSEYPQAMIPPAEFLY